MLLTIAALVLAGAVYCHFDTQALPKAVDVVSGIVGDRTILAIEKRYYGVTGWFSETLYSARLRLGIEKRHSLAVAPVPVSTRTTPGTLELGARRHDGEGRWVDKGCYLRTFAYPETKLDSIADIVFFKPGETSLHLVCGTQEPLPGGTGRIPSCDRGSVVMAFTGGFKYRHDHGGMALAGKVLRPMKNGLGTLVVFRDGRIKIARWGRDWTRVTPQMRDVRQGFMLVDNGSFCSNPLFNIYAQDKETYVRRSALGVTRQGALVYATGNDLSADGLARAMIAAGVVSAVHLEMNLSRVLCGVPEHRNGKLVFEPLSQRCCDPRSLAGTRERDFMYVTRARQIARAPRSKASAAPGQECPGGTHFGCPGETSLATSSAR